MKLILCNGTVVTVTDAQYYTAKEWAWRTFSRPEEYIYPTALFPARDNTDSGYRRCCRKLIEGKILRGNPDIGYLLDTAVRFHMNQIL